MNLDNKHKSLWKDCCSFYSFSHFTCTLMQIEVAKAYWSPEKALQDVGLCVMSVCFHTAARVREEKERGGQESTRWQTAGVGHVVFCLWEASVLQHQRPGGYHQAACGKMRRQSLMLNPHHPECSIVFGFLFWYVSPSDLLKGNFAWYWRLQREGNAQEYLGAQARISTLPRRGKDWWIVSDLPGLMHLLVTCWGEVFPWSAHSWFLFFFF